MEGINQKSEVEVLEDQYKQLESDFRNTADQLMDKMNSPEFMSEVDNPESEYEKLKSQHDELLEQMQENLTKRAEISK